MPWQARQTAVSTPHDLCLPGHAGHRHRTHTSSLWVVRMGDFQPVFLPTQPAACWDLISPTTVRVRACGWATPSSARTHACLRSHTLAGPLQRHRGGDHPTGCRRSEGGAMGLEWSEPALTLWNTFQIRDDVASCGDGVCVCVCMPNSRPERPRVRSFKWLCTRLSLVHPARHATSHLQRVALKVCA
jgi:hypothetical protein